MANPGCSPLPLSAWMAASSFRLGFTFSDSQGSHIARASRYVVATGRLGFETSTTTTPLFWIPSRRAVP